MKRFCSLSLIPIFMLSACNPEEKAQLPTQVYETSSSGNKLTLLNEFSQSNESGMLKILRMISIRP